MPAKDQNPADDPELLQLQIKDLEQKLEQMTEIGKRAVADMENMKRRTEEDRSRMAQFANADLIRGLLPPTDNFHRALQHLPENCSKDSQEWIDGVTNTFKQIDESLAASGLAEIPAENQQFDPNLHEAVLQEAGPKDQILEVLEKGYMLGEHVIRPAKVKVGMGE
ncbi:nucleotide exchange factor GrpE [Candidatus Peregrinibacteria bacterium]|jgi:molecular chaperone GrpE|nr:nucleotide exchange factor GrpE [Candidatus Peregrinibacteria bacterium]